MFYIQTIAYMDVKVRMDSGYPVNEVIVTQWYRRDDRTCWYCMTVTRGISIASKPAVISACILCISQSCWLPLTESTMSTWVLTSVECSWGS